MTLGRTEMKARVAVLPVQGLSVAKIARATGRRESTIRTHLKHMLARHSLSWQADWCSWCAPSPARPVR